MSHLYLVCCRFDDGAIKGPVKIGITKSLRGRLSALQTGSPYPLRFYEIWDLGDSARDVERFLHEWRNRERLVGEWFDIEPEKARQLIELFLNIIWSARRRDSEVCTFGIFANNPDTEVERVI